MDEKRCGTCRWLMKETVEECGYCFRIGSHMDDQTPAAIMPPMYHSSDDDAFLFVREDFGCVLHEPKPPPVDPARD